MKNLIPVVVIIAVAAGIYYFMNNNNSGGNNPLTAMTNRGGGGTMTVLAGSELKDLEPYVDRIARETGVRLQFDYSGTLDGVDSIVSGHQVDAAWFSHSKYLTLVDRGRIAAQEQIMLSPVVMGVKRSLAQQWGWENNSDLTWADIAAKAASGELQYAMTNPSSSNSGFTALMGVVAAFAGTGADAIQLDDIPQTQAQLQNFFKGQALTSGSSGWLRDAYVRDQNNLSGMINYESVLMELNSSGELREPLVLLYPKEGIVMADYPFILLNNDKRAAYDKLVTYLTSEEFQRIIMEQISRRPVIPQVRPNSNFAAINTVELPFPASAQVVDEILYAYLDKARVPSHAIFVLDVSGSMRGTGIEQLKSAIKNLAGDDTSLTGRFARFADRERITLVIFNSAIKDVRAFEVGTGDARATSLNQIRNYTDALFADGGTAIYTALQRAYEIAIEAERQDPDRYYSVVLMSDGENRDGIRLNQFESWYRQHSDDIAGIKTFPVLFGQANESEMNRVATLTGGRVFDGYGDLSAVFKKIRGYQ